MLRQGEETLLIKDNANVKHAQGIGVLFMGKRGVRIQNNVSTGKEERSSHSSPERGYWVWSPTIVP